MHKNKLIEIIEKSQLNYIQGKTKKYLKENSQFFTPVDTVEKMLNTIDFSNFVSNEILYILEPSAGCGVIVISTVLYIIESAPHINNIHFDIYEKDKKLISILASNINELSSYCIGKINLTYKIINSNFITHNKVAWNNGEIKRYYNLVISNPPFIKLNKDSSEAKLMNDVVNGQPNIYTLFMCMCTKLLAPNGYYVLLSPRNYLAGEYSKLVRQYLFNNLSLIHLHSFDKRNLFTFANQEIIISTFKKQLIMKKTKISHNGKYSFDEYFNSLLFDKNSLSIIVPRKKDDIKLFNLFSGLTNRLDDLGFKVSVGPVVQFRNKGLLRQEIYARDYAPLLIAKDIQPNNKINYFGRECTRLTHNKSISYESKQLIKHSNYVIIRKVAAKDDTELIVSAILEKKFFDSDLLGLDNNLIYFHKLNKEEELSLLECYGLYCFINSNEFSEYCSLINGTHTINISDFKEMKFPDYETIIRLGEVLLKSNNFTKSSCSSILKHYWNNCSNGTYHFLDVYPVNQARGEFRSFSII